jgi:uncharacterized protein (DUF1501 family)
MTERNLSCESYREAEVRQARPAISRRGFLLGASMATIGWMAAPQTALAQIALNSDRREGETDLLVVVFLRGGMDGLNVVVPYHDDHYYRLRPSLALQAPNKGGCFDLDGRFGLHPSMAGMRDLFEAGQMAIIQAVGSGDQTRSHFEAMSAMERGLWNGSDGAVGGWLARYLTQTARESDSALRAVALSSVMPDLLLGATSATSLPNLADYRLDVPENQRDGLMDDLEKLYGNRKDPLAMAGAETLQALKKLQNIDPSAYRPAQGATYPATPVGEAMKQTAMLVKANVGMEVACIDFGGWDTHVTQGTTSGWQPGLLAELSTSVSALTRDLGEDQMKRTTVLVMTEFGRRAYENAGLGTDHGRASVMFAIGGGVKGGKIYGEWPGLEKDQLEEPGDLRVTTDYRTVLAEALTARTRLKSTASVFDGIESRPLGIFRALNA